MEKNVETLNNHESHNEEQNEELEKLKINVTEARNSSTDLRVHHKSNVRNSQTQKSHSMLREKQDSKHLNSSKRKSSASRSSSSNDSHEGDRSLSFNQRKKIKNLLKDHISILKANESVKHSEKQMRHFYHKY